jgi:hypothetical protein
MAAVGGGYRCDSKAASVISVGNGQQRSAFSARSIGVCTPERESDNARAICRWLNCAPKCIRRTSLVLNMGIRKAGTVTSLYHGIEGGETWLLTGILNQVDLWRREVWVLSYSAMLAAPSVIYCLP